MKCTRFEYMIKIINFLQNLYINDENPLSGNEKVLEISGNTPEWLQFFKTATHPKYPDIDAHNLPYADSTYDCVIFNQVLEHVRKPWECVSEAHRVLKPAGIVIIVSPFFYQEHPHPSDFWRFTPDGLEVLVEEFSKILFKDKTGNYKMMLHMINNPQDRRSPEFKKIQYLPDHKVKGKHGGKVLTDDVYYVNSCIIAQK